MGKIIILDENTANKIAAGEVIERPASVVKELVENSIDAGATSITCEIRNGGISFIKVVDNGSGISEDDVLMAFERHATSKIRHADDLQKVVTMGFRGEALASIAAVSKVEMTTRSRDSDKGVRVEVAGGVVQNVKPAGSPVGTAVTVRELFFNTPARYKFLKKDSSEAGFVADIIERVALGHPGISINLKNHGKTVLQTPGNGDLKSAIYAVYGAETAKNIIEVAYKGGKLEISGFIGNAQIARSNRRFQSFYINGRLIRSKTVTTALDDAYATFLMKNKYPFAVLNININPALVDVNVHPTKMEVKFSNEQDVYRAVYNAVNSALLTHSAIRSLPDYDKLKKASYNFYNKPKKSPVYSQQGFEWIRGELSGKVFSKTEKSAKEESDGFVADESEICENKSKFNSSASEEYQQVMACSGQYDEVDTGQPDEAVSGQADETFRMYEDKAGELFPSLKNGARIVGQAFSTYILLEREDELFLIDQHAAHERIRYEALKEAYKNNTPFRQTLLGVIHIELAPSDYQFAISEAQYFEKLGFTYESFGNNSIILRTAPYSDREDVNVKEMFLEILDFVMNERGDRGTVTDKALFKMACKSAVKANRKMNEQEIESLLESLEALDNPYTCPHGRPAIFKVRKYDLEKMFKRIV